MAVRGRKPSENPRHRVKSEHEWVEVEDVPFDGPWPELPEERTIVTRDGQESVGLQDLTVEWWDTVKRMPHARLWSDSDWMFAKSTAMVADAAFCGVASAQTELRNREKVLGTTMEFRRDLRIRYVDGVEVEPAAENVSVMDDYRDMYGA